MITAVSAIVVILLVGAWTRVDRCAGLAITRGMVGAIIAVAVGLLLKNALASGAERLRTEDPPRWTGAGKPNADASEMWRKLQASIGKKQRRGGTPGCGERAAA